jgi:DAACS family dicarboxylate/amino acid:cation (Na+ or H+) symporter
MNSLETQDTVASEKSFFDKLNDKVPLWQQTVIGLILGGLIGIYFPDIGKSLAPVGTAFIKAIKMIIVPLVFSAVVLGIYHMATDMKKLGKMAFVTFAWFYFATAVVCSIGIIISEIFHPGLGVTIGKTGNIPENLAQSIDWVKFFLDLIPDNVVNAAARGNMLPFLFFCVVFGISLGSMGDKAKPVLDILDTTFTAVLKIVNGILRITPIAVCGIMAWVFASQGKEMILALSKLILTLYLGLFIVVILFTILVFLLGYNPIKIFRRIMEALLIGFATCSCEPTLPVLFAEFEKMGIPKKIPTFALPLGYTFNLDGSALYQSLAICFIADVYGMNLTISSLLTILLTTLIANKGTANVPSASLVVMSVILTAIGLPVEAIAILAGVDRLMDMGRTMVNVFGNTLVVLLLNHLFGNKQAYRQVNAVKA